MKEERRVIVGGDMMTEAEVRAKALNMGGAMSQETEAAHRSC